MPKPVSLTVAATMVRRKVCHFWSLRSGTHDTELVRAGGCIGCTIQVVVARETVGVKIAPRTLIVGTVRHPNGPSPLAGMTFAGTLIRLEVANEH